MKVQLKKPRVPRKLKKQLKKNPYFNIFGKLWIFELKSRTCTNNLYKIWGLIPNKQI